MYIYTCYNHLHTGLIFSTLPTCFISKYELEQQIENDNLTLAVAQCAQMLEEKVVQFNPKLTQNNCIFYLPEFGLHVKENF